MVPASSSLPALFVYGPAVDAAADFATCMLALLGAAACFRSAANSAGTRRLTWILLGAGASFVALAEPAGHLAEPALLDTQPALYLFPCVGLWAAGILKPHLGGTSPLRPAQVVDALLASVLLAVQFSLQAASLGAALWIGAAACLAADWHTTGSRRWRRVYLCLAFAALCHGTSQAPIRMTPLTADLLEAAAICGLLLAAYPKESGSVEGAGQETVPVWRELLVPALALPAVVGAAISSDAHGIDARHAVFIGVIVPYVVLVLIQQYLVQRENRALGRELQRESMHLRLLVDNIHDAVVTEDLSGRIVFASGRFLDLFGLTRDEALGSSLTQYIHPEDAPLSSGDHKPAAGPSRFEFRGLRKDGYVLYLESATVPVRLGGMLFGFQSVIRDITERRKAEERQRELIQRLEFFVTNMPLACIVTRLDFRILEWNNSAERIFGWSLSETFRQNSLDLLVPEEYRQTMTAAWEELQQSKTSNQRVIRNLTKDRGQIECEWFNTSLIDHTGRVVAVASMVQDVTEKRNLEAQLRQSQKMEAVGVLAGGIAHDFNNLLTIILGNVSLALMRLNPAQPAFRGLRDAEKAAERAAELVRQLLGFTRKSRTSPRPVSLNTCVDETLELIRRSFDPRIEVSIRRSPDLWLVEADPSQMHQVLVNLCVNARDAMPEGGRLTIVTGNRVLDNAYCRRQPEARPGEYVELSISDTGVGMDAGTVGRIFEPFFTTKEMGKGTGLGLAMVYGIVRQHEGWITVQSEPGKGSTFSIFLPRSQAVSEAQAAPSAPEAAGGAETILLVDDEEMILNLARSVLEAGGHTVLQARDGVEAVEVFHSNRDKIDLVLLDMMMPRKSGRDTLEELHRVAPEVPVVMASGYSIVGSEKLTALGARAIIQKPYHPAELARVVRRVLDEASKHSAKGPPEPDGKESEIGARHEQ